MLLNHHISIKWRVFTALLGGEKTPVIVLANVWISRECLQKKRIKDQLPHFPGDDAHFLKFSRSECEILRTWKNNRDTVHVVLKEISVLVRHLGPWQQNFKKKGLNKCGLFERRPPLSEQNSTADFIYVFLKNKQTKNFRD